MTKKAKAGLATGRAQHCPTIRNNGPLPTETRYRGQLIIEHGNAANGEPVAYEIRDPFTGQSLFVPTMARALEIANERAGALADLLS